MAREESTRVNTKTRVARALKCSLLDFLTHTSTHGAKYIGEDERSKFERFFWIGAISIGLGASSVMVLSIYMRYTGSPTVTNLEHTHYPTWRLPFPAITLCNSNRIQRTRAEALLHKLNIPDYINASSIMEGLKALEALNNQDMPPTLEFAQIQDVLNLNGLSIHEVMSQVGQPCEEMLERCSWQNEIVPCLDLFEPRKSHIGFCCSFNYIGVKDSPFDADLKPSDGPLHSRLYGQRMGLTVLVNPAIDDYYVKTVTSDGVTAFIHDPNVYPGQHIIMKMVPVNKEVLIPIRLRSRVCTESVRDLSPSMRECLFPQENHLSLFPAYYDDNCMTECRINYSVRHCSCMPYFYPDNGRHRICDLMDAKCLFENLELLNTFKSGVAAEDKLIVEEHEFHHQTAQRQNAMVCNCPAQCEAVLHEARTSWGDFAASDDTVNQLFGPDTNDTNRILIHLFLESNFSQVSKRDIATTKSVLLGLLGGICSLFLGCSFVTPLEFTYFFTIRLPGFFMKDRMPGESCPASPKSVNRDISKLPPSLSPSPTTIRDLRFPSVRRINNRPKFIDIMPPSN